MSDFHRSMLTDARRCSLRSVLPMLLIGSLAVMLGVFAKNARATDLPVYTDSLQNGFQNWSWATVNFANTSPVQSGSDSIAVTFGANQALRFEHSSFDTTPYSAVSFWVNGGSSGGQQFTVEAQDASGNSDAGVPISSYLPGGTLPANQWVQVTIPLSDLHVADTSDFSGFWLQDSTGGAQPTLYVDTVSFLGQPPPAIVHISVNAGQTLQTVDSRDFGVNTAIWDGNMGTTTTQSLMNAAGAGVFRYPGGSASDGYDWTVQQYNGQSTTAVFGKLMDGTGAQAIITANYGSGSPQMAAAWVAYCNATTTSTVTIGHDPAGRDWKTASYWATLRGSTPLGTDDGLNFLRVNHPTPYAYKNWEIGNECYGSWEEDNHSAKQDPVIYANVALAMTTLMKQVDPTIQAGLVVTSTEDDAGNQTETVTNPVTGVTHKGWTAVLFSTLNSIGYTPDFLIYHNYAQSPGGENDAVLLQYASSWTGDATRIRTMLTQYLGSTRSGPVRLVATENNSVYGDPGKQSTSLVNGLFYADSIGSLMQTEFKGLVWWDLRNGEDTSQNNSSSLYGWRLYGDYGILGNAGAQPGGGQDTPYPTYFALKLASHFARGGDTVVSATSDYNGLSAYACKRVNGTLCLLIINKNPTTDLTADITLTGYTPAATATMYQYGKVQDTAQEGGATVDLTQSSLPGVGTTFNETFPSYSMTVLTLTAPAGPLLTWNARAVAAAPDGTSRLLWTRSDGAAGIWTLTGSDVQSAVGPTYGPYAGWTAKAVSVAGDETARLLWIRSDGAAGVWKLSATGTQLAVGATYGPYTGWSAGDIAAAMDGTARVLWTRSDGAAGLWTMNASGTQTLVGPSYGPYTGWTAKGVGVAGDGTARILWTRSDGAAGLWTMSANDAMQTIGPIYGPFSGSGGLWKATDLGTSASGQSQVLWTEENGAAGVWTFSASDVQTLVGPVYGPLSGETAAALDASENQSRLLWVGTNRAASLWSLWTNDAVTIMGTAYGPY